MFKVDDRDVKELERKLEDVKQSAVPFAVRNTLNSLAFETRSNSVEIVERNMINRNRWTRNSIRVNRAQGTNVRRMEAATGSTEKYMESQEFGDTKVKKGKDGVAIATTVASGEGEGVRPRKRLPRKPNQLSSIRLRNQRIRAKSKAQRNLIAVKQAAQSGRKYLYMDLGSGRRKGIFKLKGGKRNPQVQMVHDLSRKTVTIPRNPWLRPSTDAAVRRRDEFYGESLRFQLARIRK